MNWATFILSELRQGGKYCLGHADDAELDYDDAMMPCVSVRVWDIPDICHNHHNQGSLFFQ